MGLGDIVRRVVGFFSVSPGQTTETLPIGANLVGGYGAITDLDRILRQKQDRLSRFRDYEIMDETCPEVATALNLYADYACYGDGDNDSYTVDVLDGGDEIEKIITEVEEETGIRDKLHPLMRDLVKYGEDYEEPIYDTDGHLVRVKNLPSLMMSILVDKYGRPMDPQRYYVQRDDATDEAQATWPLGFLLYFRVEGSRNTPYGRSVLASARRTWRLLHSMEESMAIARIRRAHARYVYKVKTAGMPLPQKIAALEMAKQRYTRQRMIDPATGVQRSEEAPMRVEDDLVIDEEESVEMLQGDMNLDKIGDVEYHQRKLICALGVPPAFLAQDQAANSRATLTAKDVMFCRRVRGVQLGAREGLRQLYQGALVARGVDAKGVKLDIKFPYLNVVDQAAQIALEDKRGDLVLKFRSTLGMFDDLWLYKTIFKFSDEQIEAIQKGLKVERDAGVIKPMFGSGGGLSPSAMIPGGFPGPALATAPLAEQGPALGQTNLTVIAEELAADPKLQAAVEQLKELLDWKLESSK